jgi:peptide/nickel transport system substrate-binding protein
VAAYADDRELVMSLSTKRIPSLKQFRFLGRVLDRREARIAQSLLALCIVSGVVLIGSWLSRHIETVPNTGGTLTEGLIGAPQYINPVLARPFTADADVTKLLFRGLMRVDEHMNVVPNIAESLTVSDDGKTYTAVLKAGQVWSDGSPITATDVVYTYETIADANYQSPRQALYSTVKVTATDDHTVVFTLPAATPSFRAALTLGILPSQLWQDQTPQTFSLAELNIKPVGSGPLKFQSVTKDRAGNIKSYTFIRNKLYNGTAPYIDKLVLKLYPDSTSALDALHNDAVDSLGAIDIASAASVKKDRRITAVPIGQVLGAFFNEKNVVLKLPEIRKALAMATDRDAIVKRAFAGYADPLFGPLIAGQPGYSADAKKVTTNVAQASATLEQAGWKIGADGFRSKGNQAFTFTITTVDEPMYSQTAELLAEQWKAIGAKVTVATVSLDAIQKSTIKPRQYDALLFGQLLDAGGDLYPLWHSSQQSGNGFALSVAFIKNADADLEKARSATSDAVRSTALADFQNIVVDEVPAILLVQNQYLYAHEPNLRGLDGQALVSGDFHFRNIERWYLKTRWGWK